MSFIFGLLGVFGGKIIYDRFKTPELAYAIGYSTPTDDGLVVPIYVLNPPGLKGDVLHDIKMHAEFKSDIQYVKLKTDVADKIEYNFTNKTVTSTIRRINKGNAVIFFVKLTNINITEKNPIQYILIDSEGVTGKEYHLMDYLIDMG